MFTAENRVRLSPEAEPQLLSSPQLRSCSPPELFPSVSTRPAGLKRLPIPPFPTTSASFPRREAFATAAAYAVVPRHEESRSCLHPWRAVAQPARGVALAPASGRAAALERRVAGLPHACQPQCAAGHREEPARPGQCAQRQHPAPPAGPHGLPEPRDGRGYGDAPRRPAPEDAHRPAQRQGAVHGREGGLRAVLRGL
eukprot:scaffold459_cov249-Pinguiococcus_pyrenoidosus.AAC.14